MKKILSMFAVMALSLSLFAQEREPYEKYRTIGADMPEFTLRAINKRDYNVEDFNIKGNLFVVLFNPTCGHCIQMAKLIDANYELFDDQIIVFMAGPQLTDYLPEFVEETGIAKRPKIVVGTDQAQFIEKTFLFDNLPQINIYDKNLKLVKVFTGDTPLDDLKAYL